MVTLALTLLPPWLELLAELTALDATELDTAELLLPGELALETLLETALELALEMLLEEALETRLEALELPPTIP